MRNTEIYFRMDQWLPFLIFGGAALAAGGFALWGRIYEQQRTEAFRLLANEFSFEFFPLGDSGYFDSMNLLHLFSQGRNRVWSNLMRGEAGGLSVSIFDYSFTTGSGKSRRVHRQTVICFHFDEPKLPTFSLRPESFWHKVGGLLGVKDIDFQSHPRFSSSYLLQGADEEEIRKVFTHSVLDFFESNRNLCVEAMGGRLFHYAPGVRVNPKDVRDFMARGFEILKQFRSNSPR